MATLCLGAEEGAVAMRDWLDGGLVHAVLAPRGLRGSGVRARPLARYPAPGVSGRGRARARLRQPRAVRQWQLGQRPGRGSAPGAAAERGDGPRGVFDLPALVLRETLRGLPARYVLIVDETLTRRGSAAIQPGPRALLAARASGIGSPAALRASPGPGRLSLGQPMRSIAIVGGGFSGTVLAARLLRQLGPGAAQAGPDRAAR